MRRVMLGAAAAILMACGAYGQEAASGGQSASEAGRCESVAKLELTGAKIVSAQAIGAGEFTPPPVRTAWLVGDGSLYKKLHSFCRVVAEATPSTDSSIKIEVWLPGKSEWNGKLQGHGNGGFAGEIGYLQLALSVLQGYAVVATDTGHSAEGTDARWALGHPEKVADFGYRGIHEMTRVAKVVAKAYYGDGPQHSYFGGCSNGGRQALMEAQRFPEDYDGILAGAPANYWTHLLTKALFDAQATMLDPASYIPSSKISAIAQAVNAACDAQDGVKDGILNDPRKCHFDPAAMICKEGDSEKCLTVKQVTALKKLYDSPRDANGNSIFPGYLPGAEEGPAGWGLWITGTAPEKSLLFAFGGGFFSNMVYEKADWSFRQANVDEGMKRADEKMAPILNATDANLAPFKAHGGKLILYHGWNDPAIPALNAINYYNSVANKMGLRETEEFTRLYMLPGVQHCGGGPGPSSFGEGGMGAKDAQHNVSIALEQWVEKGEAPEAIIAGKYDPANPTKGPEMTRPLCPYPQTAKYKGQGDTKDAANFVCVAGEK